MLFDSLIRKDYDITKQQRTDKIDIVVRSQIQNPIYIIKHDDNATLFRNNLLTNFRQLEGCPQFVIVVFPDHTHFLWDILRHSFIKTCTS